MCTISIRVHTYVHSRRGASSVFLKSTTTPYGTRVYRARGLSIYVYIPATVRYDRGYRKEMWRGRVWGERFFRGIFKKVSLRKCHLMWTIFFMSREGVKGAILTERRPPAEFGRETQRSRHIWRNGGSSSWLQGELEGKDKEWAWGRKQDPPVEERCSLWRLSKYLGFE